MFFVEIQYTYCHGNMARTVLDKTVISKQIMKGGAE
jgi:hypothetical protein